MATQSMKMLLPVLAPVVLIACSATGPLFSQAPLPKQTDALVYIYRPAANLFAGIQSHFFLDDVEIASLNMNGYTFLYALPGRHVLKQYWPGMKQKGEVITLPIVLSAGQSSFYRLTFDEVKFGTGIAGRPTITHSWRLTNVPASDALTEIQVTHYQARMNTGETAH